MSFKTLLAYQKGFALAMEIFQLTKTFPKEELFSLTSLIVRSSRSVVQIFLKGIEKGNMKSILKVKCLMPIVKILKLNYG